MAVDSFAFLPRSFVPLYDAAPHWDHDPVWAELATPIEEATVGLLTSAGIFTPASQRPFDVEREKREPTWGDPTLRVIPHDIDQEDIDATHLHINTGDILVDINVALPIDRLDELVTDGVVGRPATEHYSVMGYQQDGADVWRTDTGPEIAARCRAADIDALILAPA
ncbi:MAG: glycine/sarcosine/betaine reductase selenoprotein B family protein [Acidimicrobiia bacterium]|nr:glycine/sarcosine/betaine reductase selenoprotein B family protein [Acidimicrobiia bacterium]